MNSEELGHSRQRVVMRSWLDDLRMAWRSLAAAPLVTGLSILTLALGIGATAAILTVLNGVVLTPMGYPDAERLVRLRSSVPGLEEGAVWNLSSAQFVHLREHADTLESVGVWQVNARNVRIGERADRAVIGIVSHEVLDLIGARTAFGRPLGAADDTPGAAPTVMLSHDYWQHEFAADRSAIGTPLTIEGQAFEVIGVMAPSVRLPGEAGAPRLMERPDLWVAQGLNPSGPFNNSHVFMAMAKLAKSRGPGSVATQLSELTLRLPDAFPDVYDVDFMRRFGFQTEAVPLKAVQIGDTARHLWLLFTIVILVLLVALANVVNLFLARVEAQHHELIVRAALGASLWALARQILAQSMMLSVAGALLGIAAAFLGVRLLIANAPEALPRTENIGIDGVVMSIVVIVVLAIGVLLTLLVTMRLRAHAAAPVVGNESHRSTASAKRQRIRSGLVAGQVAIALVLLVAAGMLLQSFGRLTSIDPGFEPERVARVQLHLPGERYQNHREVWQFYSELLELTEALPGVVSAGAGNPLPLSGDYGCWAQGFEDAAVAERMREQGGTACGDVVVTAPGYFETLGIPVIAGRTFTRADLDHPDAGAVVVSQAFADRFWPGEDPLGKGVRPLAAPGDTPRYYRVVGVVGDLPSSTLEGSPATAVYYPIIPVPGEGFPLSPSLHLNLLVQTATAEPPNLAATIRDLVARLDPTVGLDSMVSMTAAVKRSTSRVAFSLWLLGIAALTALFLSAAGLYGVIAYLVARRTHEIGIRLALGAAGARVRNLVMVGSLKMVGLGLVNGGLASMALAQVIHRMFYGVHPGEPLPYLAAAAILLCVAALASFIPAQFAARTEPIEALRHD